MARPVEYDLNKVLDSAMEIFWQKGYEGVSMAELVSYTGLNRRTMYSLFTDKEGLFKDALENYYSKLSAQKLTILKNAYADHIRTASRLTSGHSAEVDSYTLPIYIRTI